MPREDAKRFLDQLNKNEALKKELEGSNLLSAEDFVSFAAGKGFVFTTDELQEMRQVKGAGTEMLSDDQLVGVSGGGYFWPVRGCPYGYTKFVNWAFFDDSAGERCRNCEHYFTGNENNPYFEIYKSCRLISGPKQFEW